MILISHCKILNEELVNFVPFFVIFTNQIYIFEASSLQKRLCIHYIESIYQIYHNGRRSKYCFRTPNSTQHFVRTMWKLFNFNEYHQIYTFATVNSHFTIVHNEMNFQNRHIMKQEHIVFRFCG